MSRWPQSRTLISFGLLIILGASIGYLFLILLGHHFALGVSLRFPAIASLFLVSIPFLMFAALAGFVMILTGSISWALNFTQQNLARVGAAIAVASVGLAFRFGGLLFVVFFTVWQMHSAQELWIAPKPLADFSVDHSSGRRFSFLGYEIASPWPNFCQFRHLGTCQPRRKLIRLILEGQSLVAISRIFASCFGNEDLTVRRVNVSSRPLSTGVWTW